jgi:hypothetical protein
MNALRHVVLFAAVAGLLSACDGTPSEPSPGPTGPPPSPTLTAPMPRSPAPDEQLLSLAPELLVQNGTSTHAGAKAYHFQVSHNADFTVLVVEAQGIAEGPVSTSWTVSPPLQPNTIYWWRARLIQGSDIGPWSDRSHFKSRLEGYSRPGELFDPLTNGATVGNPIGVSFLPSQGVRLNTHSSRVRYALLQTLSQGEFSVQATGLNNASPGASTKLFSMQQGTADITTNPYRGTVDKRSTGNISFRLIAGNPDQRADADRRIVQFNPSVTYLWRFTWGNGVARLVITEDDEQGRVLFNDSDSYSGVYLPDPHIAHLGAPIGRGGAIDASTPGAVIRNVWISSSPRPPGLGSLNAQ